MYPINYFVRGTGRTNILSKLYDFFANKNIENQNSVLKNFFHKVRLLEKVKQHSENNKLNINRLALECFLWGFGILDLENIKYIESSKIISDISIYINDNIDNYTLVDYNFSSQIMTRYQTTADFFSSYFDISFDNYITAQQDSKDRIKEFTKPAISTISLSDLESLRLSKPEPTNKNIEDIIRVMNRRRYMIRPSYQRKEVININKASSIIESILLGIKLPPIFVYKRNDGINEVIDGQQRLLTLLGFIGKDFLNERNKTVKSKNHKFKLKNLRILKEYNGLQFSSKLLDPERDKILDFQIYVVEIDAKINPDFDPVDLFIRLNDKPYPIRENSFEMWNSWADIEIIKDIRNLKESLDNWFFIKQIKKETDRDRMENEELLTSLCYIEYYKDSDSISKTIDVYQKTKRMNSRISTKAKISSLMQSITEDENSKKRFYKALKDVKNNIKKIKYVLIDKDVDKDNIANFLKNELDFVFNAGRKEKGFRRRIQDFYFLWILVSEINFNMVKHHRVIMKKEIIEIFKFIKMIPDHLHDDNKGFEEYINIIKKFHKKYKKDERNLKLTEEEKLALIKKQNNISSISEYPIFLGDDIEVDHIKPIAIGGKDSFDNLGIAHTDENRKKGIKN